MVMLSDCGEAAACVIAWQIGKHNSVAITSSAHRNRPQCQVWVNDRNRLELSTL